MASIGLKINHGTAGTDIASMLSKALTGNVGDQVSIQRLKMDMATEELRRRLLGEQSSLVTQQTIEQWKKNQILQDQKNANEAGAEAATKRAVASVAQPQDTAAPAIVDPTVLQSGGRGMPEVLTGSYYPPATPPPAPEVNAQPSYGQEPDWQYRVNQYPVTSEPPVPVELSQPFLGAMPNAPVASMPGLGGQPMPPEAPVPVEPSQTVVGSGAISGTGTPLLGGGGPTQPVPLPGFLQHLLRPLGELRPGEPAIVTPETTAMLGGMDQPAEQPPSPPAPAGTLGGLQLPPEAPVPVETGQPPVTAPVINPLTPEAAPTPPIAAAAPETIDLPGRPPVSPETTAATTPAAAAPATAGSPPAAPTPAQPMVVPPDQMPPQGTLTIKGVNNGQNDTATTVQTTKGTMSRADLEAGMAAEIKAAYLSGASPEAIQQAVQRIEGDYGITFDPRVGQGGDPSATTAAYTRAAGGTSPGKDTMAGQLLAKPKDPNALEGTGTDQQDQNIFREVMSSTGPLDPQTAFNFAISDTRQYGTPKPQQVYNPETGAYELKYFYPPRPPGLPTVAEVYRRAGITTAPPASGQPAPATAAPAVADAAAPGATAVPAVAATPPAGGQPATAQPVNPDGTPVITKPAEPEKLPAGDKQSQERTQIETMVYDEKNLRAVSEDELNGAKAWMDNFANQDGIVDIDVLLGKLPPKDARSRIQAAMGWAMSKLRVESGGQVSSVEIKNEMKANLPMLGDQEQNLTQKATKRLALMKAYIREGYGDTKAGKAAFERLKKDSGIDLSDAGVVTPPPAEPVPDKPPPGVSDAQWAIATDDEKRALWK